MKKVGLLLIAAAWSMPAHAAVIVQEQNFTAIFGAFLPQFDSVSRRVLTQPTFTAFDTRLGKLNSANLEISVARSATVQLVNSNIYPSYAILEDIPLLLSARRNDTVFDLFAMSQAQPDIEFLPAAGDYTFNLTRSFSDVGTISNIFVSSDFSVSQDITFKALNGGGIKATSGGHSVVQSVIPQDVYSLRLSYDYTPRAIVTPAVPEPATWAMMFLGFGIVGGTARYRRRKVMLARSN